MALREIATPLDNILLGGWRDFIGVATGVDYTDMSAKVQTEFQLLVDEAHEWIDKIYGHDQWTLREWSIGAGNLVSPTVSDGTFTMPADCRHILGFQESENGTGDTGTLRTKMEWMRAGAGHTVHPWDLETMPSYFFDGIDSSNPPLNQWRRVPSPAAALTAFTAFGRGYYDIMSTTGTAQYQGVPAAVRPETRHHLKMTWFALRGEYDKVGAESQLRDDAVKATQINDAPGGAETDIFPQPPNEFFSEMSGP